MSLSVEDWVRQATKYRERQQLTLQWKTERSELISHLPARTPYILEFTVAGFLNAPPRSHGIRWGNQINVIIHFVQISLRIICTKFHENLLKIDGDTAWLYPNWQYWQTVWHFLHILWHSIHWTYLWYLFIHSPRWFHTLAHPKNLLFSSSIRMGRPTAKLLSGSIVITPPSAELLDRKSVV